MLRGIDPRVTPELLHALAQMGHGDRIGIVDANFPMHSSTTRPLRLAGVTTLDTARLVIDLCPLDVAYPPFAYRIVPTGEPDFESSIHREVRNALAEALDTDVTIEPVPRDDFYDMARSCYTLVQTCDTQAYGCIILTKGVLGQ